MTGNAARTTPGVLGRTLALMRPFRLSIATGALMGFAAIGSNVGLMAVSAYLLSKAAISTNVADIALAVTAVRVLAISRGAFRYFERYLTHRASLRILASLRVWFYRAIEPLAPARLETHRAGDLLARIVRDVDTLEDLYVRVAVPPVVAVLVAAFASLLLGAFDARLGLVLLGFLALGGVVLPLAARWIGRRPADAVIRLRAELDATLVDGMVGMADLVAFDQAGVHLERQRRLSEALDAAQERLALLRGLGLGLGALVASLAGIVLLGLAVPMVTSGTLDGVYLALVPLAAIASFEAVQPLTLAMQQLDASRAAAARLFALIDGEPEVIDRPTTTAVPDRPDVSVRGVSFRYAADLPLVLDRFDLAIASGSTLALLGPSGSGKSTLVSLLLRFREYEQGAILLGGTDIRDHAADDVRASIGLVSQQVDLFDATIRDNLALADAGLTDERMMAACRLADIHDAISALPAGYDTRIGENGVRLSGGERQRLAIARAVLREAPVLILDEATAHLDTLTEERVMDNLAPFMRGRTTLIITHRPAVAARADRVVTLG